MLFNSWEFLLFFPVVFFLYHAIPHRFRWPLLLSASCLFYMAFIPKYILILFTTIVVDYVAALWIEKSQGVRRVAYLYVSVITTCLILFFFKYYDFFAVNVTDLAQLIGWNYSVQALKLVLPIGLSFHTFQSLSYVIEVYRGKQKAEKHFGIYALYVMFFPQLVAGPIERPQNLLHQFHEDKIVTYEQLSTGAKLVAWGLFKKVVVADRLAPFVNSVYADPAKADVLSIAVAFIFFYFQIYADFSGYSDIARGTARMLGIELMQNFNMPYLSKSLTEFWKRWHISLSTWLRDYVYEPLALHWRYHGQAGIVLALIVTFFVSGLWHGAKWTFVAWGLFHGMVMATEVVLGRLFKKRKGSTVSAWGERFRLARTFLLICISYVFFRAASFHDARYVLMELVNGVCLLPAGIVAVVQNLYEHKNPFPQFSGSFYFALPLIPLLVVLEIVNAKGVFSRFMQRIPSVARILVYQVCVLFIVFYGTWFHEVNQFIYFQF